jgi:HPt (histidine-containing phosphotransfer) domain-containing protein
MNQDDIPALLTENTESAPPIVSKLGTSNARFAKLVARFVDRLDEKLAEMDAANAAKDWETMAQLGHWLKGAGGTVGFDVFTEPASELEMAAKAGESEDAIKIHLETIHGLAERIIIHDVPTPDDQGDDIPTLLQTG